MKKLLLLAVVLLAGYWLARTTLSAVDRTEFVYRTQFGRPVETFDGADPGGAGLHPKMPWPAQADQRLDRRLQYFDLPAAELLTNDPRGRTIDQTLTVDAYVCWRIADGDDVAAFVTRSGEPPAGWRPDEKDGVDHFVRTVGTLDRARTLLGGRVSGELGAVMGQMELDDLVSVEPGKVDRQRERLRDRLLNGPGGDAPGGLKREALEKYGIELVDVRLRRLNHPPAVREAIFDRIRSERNKKAAEYQSEGAKEAERIKSDAELQVRETLAQARAEEQRLKGQADAEADRIRNEAYAKDVQFYTFLKKLDEYQRILGDGKTVLLLSAHRELFDLLFGPPKPGTPPTPGPSPTPGGGEKKPSLPPRGGGAGGGGGPSKAGGQ